MGEIVFDGKREMMVQRHGKRVRVALLLMKRGLICSSRKTRVKPWQLFEAASHWLPAGLVRSATYILWQCFLITFAIT